MTTPHGPQSPDPTLASPPLTVLPAYRPAPRPRSSLWGGLFRWAFYLAFWASISFNALILILILAFTKSDSETSLHHRHHSGQKLAHDRIALIRIDGVLFEGLTSYAQKQIEEADLLVINKSDLISPASLARLKSVLAEHSRDATVLTVSARSGAGLDDWFERLLRTEESRRHEASRLKPGIRRSRRERAVVSGHRVGVEEVVAVDADRQPVALEADVLGELQVPQRHAVAVELVVQEQRNGNRRRVPGRAEASHALSSDCARRRRTADAGRGPVELNEIS